ncbi:MAG: penicillin-binding transpeptidase domain-containing protein [Patulibacter sp.]
MSTRDRRTPTPQLALRVAAFGIIAVGVFAILFLRLWFLQVLQGDQYLTQAANNGARAVKVAAPRGKIVDRNGEPLVLNQVATVVSLQADAIPTADRDTILNWGQKQGEWERRISELSDELVAEAQRQARAKETAKQTARRERAARNMTPAQRRAETRRLSERRRKANSEAEKSLASQEPKVPTIEDATPTLTRQLENVSELLKTSPAKLYDRVRQSTVRLSWGSVPLKSKNVSDAVRLYLQENPTEFPGITVSKEYVRQYPGKDLAAQIFGTVGQISEGQLQEDRNRGLEQGQKIGQGGIEQQYDQYLRGKDGELRVEVDAQNRPTGRQQTTPPVQGNQLELTLDAKLQRTGQNWMKRVIGNQIDNKTGFQAAGSFVALDPRDGAVLAMGSYPSVDLNELSGAISLKRYNRLLSKRSGSPAVNRATNGLYPMASTFKIVSAMAMLANGVRGPDDVAAGGAYREFGTANQRFYNAGKVDLGGSNLPDSLTQSSDVYYYDVGAELFRKPDQPLQRWARLFGFGRTTGVDLPGEAKGVVPDAAWRKRRNEQELECRKQRGVPNCFTVADINGQYLLGDNVNLSVGQGDLLGTPLQLAVAYSGFYQNPNEPIDDQLRFPTPYLGHQVQNSRGELLQQFDVKQPRAVSAGAADWKRKILQGLQGVTTEGTAAPVFAGWDQSRYPAFGKTGTAERCQNQTCADQSWFAVTVPDAERPITVVVTAEAGGFGTEAAAPIACKMLRTWYGQSGKQAPCSAPTSNANRTE